MASTGGQQANEEDKLILSLCKDKGWAAPYLYLFEDFWRPSTHIQGVNNFQKYFQAKDDDVIVASFPKSATTSLSPIHMLASEYSRWCIQIRRASYLLLPNNPT
ncbi:Cytosolic sulfotransferase 13 [Spatholobus suberectus]|nr:Cytosolic sulfotransferase 13 [Spatholobus suberectus]